MNKKDKKTSMLGGSLC